MAYQPKSYRKLLAASASTAVVASAIAPVSAFAFSDVPAGSEVAEAVNYLTGKGAVNGYTNGTFAPNKSLTRAEAATIFAKSLGLDVANAPTSGLSDINSHWAKNAINALVEEGIINGYTDGTFKPDNVLTRAEMAKIVAAAYQLEENAASAAQFTDVPAWAKGAVGALVDNNITKGVSATSFGSNQSVTRGQTAVFAKRAEVDQKLLDTRIVSYEVVDSKNIKVKFGNGDVKEVELETALKANEATDVTFEIDGVEYTLTVNWEVKDAAVTAVSATNGSTLSVTGTNLSQLKAEDVVLTGNSVDKITASEDGKSATVTLKTLLTPDVEHKVTVKGTEYKVTYKLVADTAQITEKTYDNNTPNQFVEFTVNGVKGNVADLLANGYTVNFTATNKGETAPANNIFSNQTTGELATNLNSGDEFKVQVTISNGTKVIVSSVQTIKISNLDLSASSINSYELTRGSVVQSSSTLVVGETASFQNLKVTIDGTEEKNRAVTKVESSNKAVVSVNSSNVLTAHTPGTATVTLTFGTVKKDVTITVANEERKVKSVKVVKSQTDDAQVYNTTVIGANGTKTLTVVPLDQYGDAMNSQQVNIESTSTSVATAPANVTAGANGKVDFTIQGVKAGNTTLIFKHPTNSTTLATFGVNISENAGSASKKLEIIQPKDTDANKKSADNTLDLSDDSFVEYNLNEYTSEGHKIGAVALGAYTATPSDTTVVNPTIAGNVLTITGLKKGDATVNLKDSNGVSVGTISISVVDNGTSITNVTFKPQTKLNYAKTVDYKQFFTYTEGSTDPVITGISLSKTTNNAIRLNGSTLYLDQDGSATYTAGDKQIGVIQLYATSDSTGLSTSVGTSEAVTSGEKGTLVFVIKEVASNSGAAPAQATAGTKILASTSLEVDVK